MGCSPTTSIPRDQRSAGRLRRLRGLGARRGRRQAHLLRSLRPAAPGPGVRRHGGLRRPPDLVYKDMGLVSQVFNEARSPPCRGIWPSATAVLHHRLHVWENAQPTFRPTATGHLALAHNGNLTNTLDLAVRVAEGPVACGRPCPSTGDRPGHLRHRAAHRAAGRPRRRVPRGRRRRRAAHAAGRVQPRVHGRHHPVRRSRPPGHPPAGDRPAASGAGRGLGDRALDIVGAIVRARGRSRAS